MRTYQRKAWGCPRVVDGVRQPGAAADQAQDAGKHRQDSPVAEKGHELPPGELDAEHDLRELQGDRVLHDGRATANAARAIVDVVCKVVDELRAGGGFNQACTAGN